MSAPEGFALATSWEEDRSIRRAVRERKQLCQWKSASLIGVVSCEAAAANVSVLVHVASWWAPQKQMPQAIPIEKIRKEACFLNDGRST